MPRFSDLAERLNGALRHAVREKEIFFNYWKGIYATVLILIFLLITSNILTDYFASQKTRERLALTGERKEISERATFEPP